jgi:hypothetical protein
MNDHEKKEAVREVISTWSYHAGRFDAEAMGKLFLDDCEFHGTRERTPRPNQIGCADNPRR